MMSKAEKVKETKKKTNKKSWFRELKHEWKGISKPTGKELSISTCRTVIIAVLSALAISIIDFGFTHLIVQITNLM